MPGADGPGCIEADIRQVAHRAAGEGSGVIDGTVGGLDDKGVGLVRDDLARVVAAVPGVLGVTGRLVRTLDQGSDQTAVRVEDPDLDLSGLGQGIKRD